MSRTWPDLTTPRPRFAARWPASVLWLPGLLLAVLLQGCTSMTAYHGLDLPAAQPCPPRGLNHNVLNPCRGPITEQVSLEGGKAYTLHHTEFDDQGWVFDPAALPGPLGRPDQQINQVMRHLTQALGDPLAEPARRLRLFVYVHGWRHSAAPDDDDLHEFHKFLARQAGRADLPQGEQVVGIYVGWRGTPIADIPGPVYLTFWDRKSAAERVAQGSIRELFSRLRALKRRVDAPRELGLRMPVTQPGRPGDAVVDNPAITEAARTLAAEKIERAERDAPSRLRTTIIGHSFGASIVFRSLSQALIAAFADDLDDGNQRVAEYFDAVVLINPAIEAARFQPLFDLARQRVRRCEALYSGGGQAAAECGQPLYQRPLLMVFTSEGDWATRYAFPVGGLFDNLFQKMGSPLQREATHNTVGWVDALITHDLRPAAEPCVATTPALGEQISEQVGPVRRYRAAPWEACLKLPDAQGARPVDGAATQPVHRAAALLRQRAAAPGFLYNGPLWNVRVDKALMDGHNDIWNDRFVGLLHQAMFD